jgi:hypothetical protein
MISGEKKHHKYYGRSIESVLSPSIVITGDDGPIARRINLFLNSALSSYLSSASSSHISPLVLPLAPSLYNLRFHGESGVNKDPDCCLWCDEIGHQKKECLDLVATFREGKVLFDRERKVIDAITELHLPV